MAAGESSQIYEELMRFRPDGLTPNAWAMRAGVSRTVWADMRRHGNPSRRTLEKLLTAAGSSLAEFEAFRVSSGAAPQASSVSALADRHQAWRRSELPGLPLLSTSIAGEWRTAGPRIELTHLCASEIVERLPRPASLGNDPGAYAVTIVGDSMWPRFRPGRRVAVSPRAPVAIGDDVLVKLKHGESESGMSASDICVLVKELERISATDVELRQFKPDTRFRVPVNQIAAIEKILGELI